MTKGTKIYYGIAAVIIMGLMAYNWHQGGLITIVSSFISIIVAAALAMSAMAFIDMFKKPQKTISKQKRNKVKRRIANTSRRKNRS